ncbi:MAG: hypothetical protein WCO72_10225 [Betaproteobacteria bacterium]
MSINLQVTTDQEIVIALNVLSNWVFKSPETRDVMHQVIATLDKGDAKHKQTAIELNAMISYLGSLDAIKVANALSKATKEPHARKLGNIEVRGRGKKYKVTDIQSIEKIMFVTMRYVQGQAKREQLEDVISNHYSRPPDTKAINELIKELKPIAKKNADFINKFSLAYKNKSAL